MIYLNWTGNRMGPSSPCRVCGDGALLRDDQGKPCHKVCAEAVLNGSRP